jgi:hypothetical protein
MSIDSAPRNLQSSAWSCVRLVRGQAEKFLLATVKFIIDVGLSSARMS